MILAASAAAGVNLTAVFEELWRWPLSAVARDEARAHYGAPVGTAPYE